MEPQQPVPQPPQQQMGPQPMGPQPVYNTAPQPVAGPQPIYSAPQPAYGAPTGQTFGGANADAPNYHSNPFAVTLHQLSILINANPISILTLGMLMFAIIFGVMFVVGIITGISQSLVMNAVGLLVGVVTYVLVLLRFYAAGMYLQIVSRENRTLTARQAASEVAKHNYGKFVLTTLLSGLFLGIGFILLFIPGFYLMGRILLAPIVALSEGLGAMASIKRSWQLTKGHWFEMIAVLIAESITFYGGLLGLVGGSSGLVGRYFELRDLQQSGAAKPKVHWLNFALPGIIIAIIGAYIAFFAYVGNSASNLGKSSSTCKYKSATLQAACLNSNSSNLYNTTPTNDYNSNYNYNYDYSSPSN